MRLVFPPTLICAQKLFLLPFVTPRGRLPCLAIETDSNEFSLEDIKQQFLGEYTFFT